MILGYVNSVHDGVVNCTIDALARHQPLEETFALIRMAEELRLYRFGSIDMINQMHMDPTFQPWIMHHGKLEHYSGEIDIERSNLQSIAIVDINNQKISKRGNPLSGTNVESMSQEEFVRFYNEKEHYAVIGSIPNIEGLEASIVNRHHGPYEDGGYGEARHTCIFGQNGSGKTVLALQLLVLKLWAHPEMGLLMPDTAGDLSDEDRHNRGGFLWDYIRGLRAKGIEIDVITTNDIRLTSKLALKDLMQEPIKKLINTNAEKSHTLANLLVDSMFDKEIDDITKLTVDAVIDRLITIIPTQFSGKTGDSKAAELQKSMGISFFRENAERGLKDVRAFFDGREKLYDLIADILENGRKVVIKMHTGDPRQQEYIMRELMEKLNQKSRENYLYKNQAGSKSCNALVVLDEGSRWVPEGKKDTDDIGSIIEFAYKETRKYGLGWMIISQRPSDISKGVLTQAHTKYFGRGVGTGNDANHLEDHVGPSGRKAYEDLSRQGGYFWVAIGQDANIGTEGMYFSFHPFGGDSTQKLIDANQHLFRSRR